MFKTRRWKPNKCEGSYRKSRAERKKTCWGGSVALRGLAGRTSSYSINAQHTETIVDVAVEFENG